MNYIEDYRASKILYNFLVSNNFKGKFILPANICPVVPLTFLQAGAEFSFVDIAENDLCLDQDAVLNIIRRDKNKYSGVLFVKTYGVEKTFDDFFVKIKEVDDRVVIIDDCCLSKPSIAPPENTPADLVLYSTGYAKYIDIGNGGYAFLNDKNNLFRYNKIKTAFRKEHETSVFQNFSTYISNHKKYIQTKKYHWLNNKKPPENYLLTIENHLIKVERHKKKLNTIYSDIIPSEYVLPAEYLKWRFNILVPESKKTKILEDIFSHRLFASGHYVSLARVFTDETAPVSEKIHSQIINLFNDLYYTEEQAEKTALIIRNSLQTS